MMKARYAVSFVSLTDSWCAAVVVVLNTSQNVAERIISGIESSLHKVARMQIKTESLRNSIQVASRLNGMWHTNNSFCDSIIFDSYSIDC